MNNSGWRKKALKPGRLIKISKSPGKSQEERKAEAEESFKLHKRKAWMLTKGTADEVKKFGNDPKQKELMSKYKDKEVSPQSPELAFVKNFIKPNK